MPVCIHRPPDITDTERHLLAVGDDSVFLKRHVHVVQLRGAHLARPPDAGVLHRFLHGERAFLAGGQGDGKGKAPALVRAANLPFHGTRGTVLNQTINQDDRRRQVFGVYDRSYKNVPDLHIRRDDDLHGAGNAHALVQGAGVPVHIAVVELFGLRTINGYL